MEAIDSKLMDACKQLKDAEDETVFKLSDEVLLLITMRSTLKKRSSESEVDPPWLLDVNATVTKMLTSNLNDELRNSLFALISGIGLHFAGLNWFINNSQEEGKHWQLLVRLTFLEMALQMDKNPLNEELMLNLLTVSEFILRELMTSDNAMELLGSEDQLMSLLDTVKDSISSLMKFTPDCQSDDLKLQIIQTTCLYAQMENERLTKEMSAWFLTVSPFLIEYCQQTQSNKRMSHIIKSFMGAIEAVCDTNPAEWVGGIEKWNALKSILEDQEEE